MKNVTNTLSAFIRAGTSLWSRALPLALGLVVMGGIAHAQTTQFWNPGATNPASGGTGTWDTTTASWSTTGTTTITAAYNNASPNSNTAVFTATTAAQDGTVTLAASTTINANTLTFNTSSTGSYTIAGASGSVLAFSGTTPTININNTAGTNVISANLSDAGSLTINGNATGGGVNLTGTNSLTGTVILNLKSSTLGVTSTTGNVSGAAFNPLGTATIEFVSNGQINFRNTTTFTSGAYGNNVQINGGNGTLNVGSTMGHTFSFGTLTFSAANQLIFAGNDPITFTSVVLNANGTISFGSEGSISGSSIGAISDDGNGRSFTVTAGTGTSDNLAINGASTYTGSTTITSNTVLVGVNNALPTTTGLTLGGVGTATLNLNGHNQTLGSLATAGTAASQITQIITNSASGASVLTYAGGATPSTYVGKLTDSGASHTLGLAVSSGTLTLSGTANTYIGGTTISGGTLVVNNSTGSATGAGALVVSSGATLTGTGTIHSTTNTISGNVIVGNGGTTDVLTVTGTTSTTFTNASLTFNLGTGGGGTTLGIGSTLALGSTASVLFGTSGTSLTINLVGGTLISSATPYVLFTSTVGGGVASSAFGDLLINSDGQITNFSSLIINSSQPAGYYANSYLSLVNLGTGNGYSIDLEVVPEPGTWVLMLGGFALLVICQRARRNKSC